MEVAGPGGCSLCCSLCWVSVSETLEVGAQQAGSYTEMGADSGQYYGFISE